MNELFGIPMDSLAVVLAVLVAVALGPWARSRYGTACCSSSASATSRADAARTALIVVGLMLGTTIIAAALTTGDTMSHTIRSTATKALGETDEVVSAAGRREDISGELGAGDGHRLLRCSGRTSAIESALASDLVDGVTGAIVEEVAVQAPATAADRADGHPLRDRSVAHGGLRPDSRRRRREVVARRPWPGEIYLNDRSRRASSRAESGDPRDDLRRRDPGPRFACARSSTSTAPAQPMRRCCVPLDRAQALLGKQGRIKHVLVSNRGERDDGVGLTDEVAEPLQPTHRSLGLEVATAKQDALDDADEAGNAFMSLFTTFGTFSIAAGILLIFLIFVMLAAERRGELGIARAVGTRRGHLVQMFVFEGAGLRPRRRRGRRALGASSPTGW